MASPRTWPIGLLLLLAVAVVLWLLTLANAVNQTGGGGEASLAQAIEALFFGGFLWLVLALMLITGGVLGSMPRWVAFSAVVLVPMAAVADFVAVDMCSRHMRWAVVFVAVLPALVAFYAFWARLPAWQVAMPARRTSLAVWGAVLGLSVVAFVAASL